MRLTAKTPWTDEFATIVFSLGHSFRTVPLDQAISIDVLLKPIQPDSSTGIGDVIHYLLKQSNHPPLYFVLAHLWMRWFPPEDGIVSMWAARSLPAIFSTLSIPAMYGLGYLAFRSRLVGQMAAAIMAVSPFGIFLAQEARHYSLAILWVIASVCCLIVAVQHLYRHTLLPLWVGLTWVLINTLGVATHYFFALTLGAEALVLLAVAWRQGNRDKEKSLNLIQDGEAAFTPKLRPVTPTFWQRLRRRENPTQTISSPHSLSLVLGETRTKANVQFFSKTWRRIYRVAAGTVTGSLVWLPILQANYDYDLTHWIYDGNPLERWIEPIGRVLAWLITILTSLPMELTTLPMAILIASGVVTLIFVVWAIPILRYGLKPEHFSPDIRLNLQVLGDFMIGAMVLFFGITYTLGADMTLAPRYQFVYFPVAIALIGAALATSWHTLTQSAQMPLTPHQPSSRVRFSRRGGKKAVILIWLMGLLGGVTVTWNLGYLQSIRPDLMVNVIEKLSDAPVLIATTHQHHGHTGRMMGLAWEFKHIDSSNSSASRDTTSPTFLLAHDESDSQLKNPTITLQETVAGLPRPLDVWLVNFHAGIDLAQQKCFAAPQRLPKVDSYWYRLYHCPATEQGNNPAPS
jgi:uncharacterized membrane protein